MSRLFGIAGVQMAPIAWEAQATVAKMADAVVQIGRNFPWVQLVMFHELAVPGLVQLVSAPTPELWRQNAQTIPGPLTEELCAIARRARKWLVPGSMYELDGDTLYNTALAISPDGQIVARYRKMFPWLPYEGGTTAGRELCVFDIPGVGRFGLCICYDIWFPEVARSLVWLGAEVILQPTMTPTSDRSQELVLCQATSIFNQAYVVSVNGVGPYGGGRSLIVDPDGRVLQQTSDHETIMTEILDLERVTHTREFGTLGLSQTLKQLRDSGHQFPIYQQGVAAGEGFRRLGPLGWQRSLNLPA